MAIDVTAATDAQFDEFLIEHGFSVPLGRRPALLAFSFSFLKTIAICTEGDTHVAQCYIAYAMSEAGGGFNPAGIIERTTLTKKGLGRNAILKEWKINEQLSGIDTVSLLKSVPMAYGILQPLLCQGAVAEAGTVGNFDVVR